MHGGFWNGIADEDVKLVQETRERLKCATYTLRITGKGGSLVLS